MFIRILSVLSLATALGCATVSNSRPEHFQGYATAKAPGPDWDVVEGLLIVDIEKGGRPVQTFRLLHKQSFAEIEAIARPNKLSEPEYQAEASADARRREGCEVSSVRVTAGRSRAAFSYSCPDRAGRSGTSLTQVVYLRPTGASKGLIEIEGETWGLEAAEMEKALSAVADSIRLVSPRP